MVNGALQLASLLHQNMRASVRGVLTGDARLRIRVLRCVGNCNGHPIGIELSKRRWSFRFSGGLSRRVAGGVVGSGGLRVR